jgi:hypothetical protein
MSEKKKLTSNIFKMENENTIERYPVILKESGYRKRENIAISLFKVINKAYKVLR